MTWFDVYLITRLSYVQGFFIITAIILGCSAFAVVFYSIVEEEWERTKTIFTRIVIGMFISILLACLTPNTKEVFTIYLVPKIANNEQVKRIPDNVLKFVNEYLEEKLDKQNKHK